MLLNAMKSVSPSSTTLPNDFISFIQDYSHYVFYPIDRPTKYHIWTDLELKNDVLNTDSDINSSGWTCDPNLRASANTNKMPASIVAQLPTPPPLNNFCSSLIDASNPKTEICSHEGIRDCIYYLGVN